MRSIAINLHARRGLDTPTYIKKMREVGFDALFTETPTVEELKIITNALAANGMRYELIHAPFDTINNMWLKGEAGDRTLADLITAVNRAAEGGCPTVVVHLSSGKTPPTITDIGRARFQILVEYAACKNVNIAFENQRKLANIAWAFEYFADAPNVGFCWDCGHEACFAGGREYMPLFGDKLICTHLHDNSGKPDDDQHLLPFDGSIDFGRVAKRLRESKYQGTLTLEIFDINNHNYDFVTPMAFLEKAAMVAKRLRRMVDGF